MPDPLDIEHPASLIAYLRRTDRIDCDETPAIHVLAGGVSNRTVLVERASGEAWVLKQALAKLRVKVDWFSDPARIEREATGLKWLAQLAPRGTITPLIFEDYEENLLAMAAVPQPHENWKTMLLAGNLQSDHLRQFAMLLGTVHRRAYEQREKVAPAFDERSFFESLRLEAYYQYSGENVPQAARFLADLIESTRARRLTLVHGDYSPKNVLVHNDKLVLLDHEVIHFGDPAFDLGFALTHLLSKGHHLPQHRAAFALAAAQFWNIYRDELRDPPWAGDLQPFAVRQTLGCLLARVAGRSPLEYLNDQERSRQRDAVVELMRDPPETVADLATAFLQMV